MAVIHECGDRRAVPTQYGIGAEIFGNLLDWLRDAIADDLWRWYYGHEDDVVVTLRKWVFNIKVRVRHLYPLFIILFGDPDEVLE